MTQHIMATGKRPSPFHAAMIPMTSASIPGSGDDVVSAMAGNVITARVT